jgi:hypothetical protein
MSTPRPADFAQLRLAAAGAPPRQRARDQQADLAGLDLERRILHLLVSLDPEPDALHSTLSQIVADIGPPSGPARSLCALIRDDWHAFQSAPAAWGWLVTEALAAAEPSRRKRRPAPEGPADDA